jgi:hypothetical protein
MGGSGDAAKKTQEQLAMERRQRIKLDEETAASERRLKAIAQKKLGKQSLLAKPIMEKKAPTPAPTVENKNNKSLFGKAASIAAMMAGR